MTRRFGRSGVKQEIKGPLLRGIGIEDAPGTRSREGFGADGVVVDSENGLGDVLAAAVRTGRTTVIGVRIDGSGYVAQFNALREL